LKAAQVQLRDTEVRAVWEAEAGDVRFVGERFVEEGAVLSPNAPLLSVIDLDTVEAVIHVPERDLPSLRTGQPADMIADAYPGRVFPGTVTRISPLLRESSRKAPVEISIPNPEGLLNPGMFVLARIEFARRDDAVLVPLDALLTRDETEGVFLVVEAEAKVRFVAVTKGFTEGARVEILSPALAGRVVTLGAHLLRDGSPVRWNGGPGKGERSGPGGGRPGGGPPTGRGEGKGGGR
jgi:RND family efflux transporter MFP subunit